MKHHYTPRKRTAPAYCTCEAPIRNGGARGLCARHYQARRRARQDSAVCKRGHTWSRGTYERCPECRSLKRTEGEARAKLIVGIDTDAFRATTENRLSRTQDHACRDCGCPTAWGFCPRCVRNGKWKERRGLMNITRAFPAGITEPEPLPVVVVGASELNVHFTGRLSHRRPKRGKIVLKEKE